MAALALMGRITKGGGEQKLHHPGTCGQRKGFLSPRSCTICRRGNSANCLVWARSPACSQPSVLRALLPLRALSQVPKLGRQIVRSQSQVWNP